VLGLLVLLIWVGVDSGQRDFSQSKYWRSSAGWIISCILLWIVYFPIYLFARKKAPRRALAPIPVTLASSNDTLDQLSKLAELRDSGVLTPEEFSAQKAIVLDQNSA